MRLPIVLALVLAAGPAGAEGPAISADGSRIELPERTDGLASGSRTSVFCDAGAQVDDRCTRFETRYDHASHHDARVDNAAAEKSIADTRTAGGFTLLPVIALHRIAPLEMLGPQSVVRSRVTRTSGGLTIAVGIGTKDTATITISRGRRRIASARWGCESYGGDQAAITSAVVVGREKVVYAELSCSTYSHWLRVSPSR